MEIMKKEQTRKRKENNDTRKKVRLHKESAKPKFNKIVKLTKTKHAKGQQKDKRTNTFVK